MLCKNCGNQISDAAQICERCGRSVTDRFEAKPAVAAETILYKPVGTWKRLGNFVGDRISMGIIFIIIAVLISWLIHSTAWTGVFFILMPFLYYVIFEGIWQKTIAKFITKTKVVMRDGSKPPFLNILGRSLARYIPFEAFSYLFGAYPMGWHDSLSKTLVVPSEYTEEDVRKIDIDKVKRVRGTNAAVLIIVIFIAILIGIVIIGTLSSVVLVSLNTARQKGQDARTVSDVSQMRVLEETYYSNNNSYSHSQDCGSGAFQTADMQKMISDIPSKSVTCYAENSSFAVSAKLSATDKSFCVDSTGYNGDGTASDDGTTAVCRTGAGTSIDPKTSANNAGTWQTFESTKDSFSVLFPGDPRFDSRLSNDVAVPYTTDFYTSSSGDIYYYVFRYKYQSDINAKPEAKLDGALSGLIGSDRHNHLVSSNHGTFGKYASLDFYITNMDDSVKGRFIIKDQSNMYLVMSESTNFDDSTYSKFLESFAIK